MDIETLLQFVNSEIAECEVERQHLQALKDTLTSQSAPIVASLAPLVEERDALLEDKKSLTENNNSLLENKKSIETELADCRSQLQALIDAKDPIVPTDNLPAEEVTP